MSIQDNLEILSQWMEKQAPLKAEIAKARMDLAMALAPVQAELDDVDAEIARIRQEINAEMEESGVRTIDGEKLQAQRAATGRWQLLDIDKAIGHIGDLGRIGEVTSVDPDKVVELAKIYPGGIDGVERVTTYVFKITPRRTP